MIENLEDPLGTFSLRPPRLSLSDIYRLRDLRAMEKTLKESLACIRGHSDSNRDDIDREKVVLQAVRRDIRRRERIHFLLEFGS